MKSLISVLDKIGHKKGDKKAKSEKEDTTPILTTPELPEALQRELPSELPRDVLSTDSLRMVVDDLCYCCNVVLEQQIRMDEDMAQLKKFTKSLRTFVTNLEQRVLTLSSVSDQQDAKLLTNTSRLDSMEERLADCESVQKEISGIQTDLATLSQKVSEIKIE
jgi:hypothetical protein